MLQELTDYGMYRPMRVISNHIPAHVFRPLADKQACKQKYGIGQQAILIFGRIATEKNLDFVLDIFADVSSKTDAQLIFVGDGPYRADLEQKVAGHIWSPRVHFLGALRGEALVEAINACELFLITSMSETQSMTTLQAMSCGLPVVVINVGGLPEYVNNGVTGYVVNKGDKQTFVARVCEILADPTLAQKMGEAGRESTARYSPEAITKEFEAIYTSVLPAPLT